MRDNKVTHHMCRRNTPLDMCMNTCVLLNMYHHFYKGLVNKDLHEKKCIKDEQGQKLFYSKFAKGNFEISIGVSFQINYNSFKCYD